MNFNIPQNLKFKKYCKKFIYKKRGHELKVNNLLWGSYCGLVAKEDGIITTEQLRTCIALITKIIKIKRKERNKLICSVIIRAPLTKKALGSRMGRGKGNVARWVSHIRRGRMLFQVQNIVNTRVIFLAFRKVMYKLPFLTRIVLKHPLFFRRYNFSD